MPPFVIRNGPLNILVALADSGLDVAHMLPALKPHYGLVCSAPSQALAAARQFEPDIVFIDCRMPDPVGLVRQILHAAGSRNVIFVAMISAAGRAPEEFQYSLPMPATASDLDNILWRVGHGRAAGAQRATLPGSGMIG
jgi:two-component SAPR family response regulator